MNRGSVVKSAEKKEIKMKSKSMMFGLLVVAGYIGAQMLADISALKVAMVAGFAVAGGTFIYPLTFTLRDMIHKSLGKKMARAVVISAGVINIFMVLYLKFITDLQPAESWPLQEQFGAVFGIIWRITLASILAEIVSELVDTEAYSFYVNKITRKYQWGRVLFSNAISVPLDSFIFVTIAFAGILPWSLLWSMILGQIIVKSVVSLASIPSIYLTKDGEGVEL